METQNHNAQQESFDEFRNSEAWNTVCMINEVGDFFDIVIRDEKDPEYKALCGVCWNKSHFTPGQLQIIRKKQKQLKIESFVSRLIQEIILPFSKNYDWGICRDDGYSHCHMDGTISATSPEEAERKLRADHCQRHTTITVFY